MKKKNHSKKCAKNAQNTQKISDTLWSETEKTQENYKPNMVLKTQNNKITQKNAQKMRKMRKISDNLWSETEKTQENYIPNMVIDTQNNKITQKNEQLQNDNFIDDNIQIHNYNENINEVNKCNLCNKIFVSSYNLKRHLVNFCKYNKQSYSNDLKNLNNLNDNNDYITLQNKYNDIKDKYDDIKEDYSNIKEKFDELLDLIKNNKNNLGTNANINNLNNINNINSGQINSNNQTNSNNINIFQFGKEDYSKIPNQLILKAIMSSTGAGIPCNLIEKLHFNNDFPELKNICITDRNRKYALLWNGKKWIRHKYNDIGTDMLDRCLCLISDRMDELDKIVTDKKVFNIKKKALDKLENVNSEDEAENSDEDEKITMQKINNRQKFRKQASEKIEESLYNNRDLIYNNQN